MRDSARPSRRTDVDRHHLNDKSFVIKEICFPSSYSRLRTDSATNKPELISMTAEILLTLYRAGWEPMTPVDLCVKDRKKAQNQTAICFRRETPEVR